MIWEIRTNSKLQMPQLLRMKFLLCSSSPRPIALLSFTHNRLLSVLIFGLDLQTLVKAVHTLRHIINIIIANSQIMPGDVMFSTKLHTHLEQRYTCIIVTQSHRQSSEIEIHILRGRQWIEVFRDVHDISLEVALHFIACIRDMIHQHLLELVEDFTFIAAEANQGENVLERRRRRFIADTTL